MSITAKKIISSIIYNICFFVILMIGIQNSSNQTKVFLWGNESAKVPVSFIVGVSFITGSTLGSYINLLLIEKKD